MAGVALPNGTLSASADAEDDGLYLKYGDVISLRTVDATDGFVQAGGFVDALLYCEPVRSGSVKAPANYYECLFQVAPSRQYAARKALHRRLEEFGRHNSSLGRSSMSSMSRRARQEVNRLRDDEANEVRVNNDLEKRLRGRHVTYGSTIQLRHMRSHKYITMQARELAYVEKQNMCISLDGEGNEGSWFSLQPRYKNRTEGERIFVNDPLMISSPKFSNYAHVSRRPVDKTKKHEINGAADISTFKFVPYHPVDSEPDAEHALFGGQVVRFHNEESNTNLGGGGRAGRGAFFRMPASSESDLEQRTSNSMWRLELDNIDMGGRGRYSNLYRFRHLNTNQYLAPGKSYTNTLTNDAKFKRELRYTQLQLVDSGTGDDTLFELLPSTIQEPNAMILFAEEKIRIRHHVTGYFLHVTMFDMEKSEMEDDESEIFSGKSSDGGSAVGRSFRMKPTFFKAVLSSAPYDEDMFSILQTPDAEVDDSNFLRSARPALIALLKHLEEKKRGNGKPDKETSLLLETAVERVSHIIFFVVSSTARDPLAAEGLPNPQRQKICREAGIMDLVSKCIFYPFDSGLYHLSPKLSEESPDMFNFVQLCYHLLRHSFRSYAANEIYASRWLPRMVGQLGNNLKAAGALTALLSGNRTLLENLPENIIDRFLSLIKERGKLPRFMKFLMSLCVCDGEPVHVKQELLARKIFVDRSGAHVLIDIFVDQRGTVMIGDDTSPCANRVLDKPMPLTKLVSKARARTDEGTAARDFLQYTIHMITLLKNMCQNRNALAIQHVRKYAPFDLVIKVLRTEELMYGEAAFIRSAFVRLLIRVFIDVEPMERLTLPSLTRVWDKSHDIRLRSSEHELEFAEEMKSFAVTYLSGIDHAAAVRKGRNEMTSAVLLMVRMLLEFGQYRTEEGIGKIVGAMAHVLDGRTDEYVEGDQRATVDFSDGVDIDAILAKADSFSRFEVDEYTIDLMEQKAEICRIFFLVMELRVDYRISLAIKLLRDRFDSRAYRGSSKFLSEDDAARVFTELFNPKYRRLDLAEMASSSGKLLPILFDLCMYQHAPLVDASIRLLGRRYGQREALLDALRNLQVLTNDDAVDAYEKIRVSQRQLARNAAKLSHIERSSLDADTVRVQDALVADTIRILKTLTATVYGDDIVSSSSSSSTADNDNGDDNGGDTEPTARGEQKYRVLAKKKSDAAGKSAPRPVRQFSQRLLRNMRVHETVISILQRFLAEHLKPLYAASYEFLTAFTRGNAENQTCMHEHLSVFERHMGAQVNAPHLISEIFFENRMNCYKIKESLIHLFAQVITEENRRPVYLRFFRTILYASGRIVKQNQWIVLSALVQVGRARGALFLCRTDADFELRRAIMADPEHPEGVKNPNGLLAYHIELIKLLFMAAHGKNYIVEAKCQQLLPVSAIHKTVIHADTTLAVQAAYLAFYYQVYLDVERQYEGLGDHRLAWMIFLHCAAELRAWAPDDEGGEDAKRQSGERALLLPPARHSSGVSQKELLENDDLLDLVVACAQAASQFCAKHVLKVPEDPRRIRAIVDAEAGIRALRDIGLDTDRHNEIENALQRIADIAASARATFTSERPTMNKRHSSRIAAAEGRSGESNNNGSGGIELTDLHARGHGGADELNADADEHRTTLFAFRDHEAIPPVAESGDALVLTRRIDDAVEKMVQSRAVRADSAREFLVLVKEARTTRSNYDGSRPEGALTFDALIGRMIEHVQTEAVKPASQQNREHALVVSVVFRLLCTLVSDEAGVVADPRQREYEEAVRSTNTEWIRKIAMQMRLNDLGASSLVVRVLGSASNDQLVIEAMQLANALLDGGNAEIQYAMFRHMEEERRKSDGSLSFLGRLRERFRAGRAEIRMLKNEWKARQLRAASSVAGGSAASATGFDNIANTVGDLSRAVVTNVGSVATGCIRTGFQFLWSSVTRVRTAMRSHEELAEEAFLERREAEREVQMSSGVNELFRFLQLLCEGHNEMFQEYLRVQPGTTKSMDLVSEMVMYLKKLEKYTNTDNFELLLQVWNTIIEVVQGPCKGNQDAMVNAGLIESANNTLRKDLRLLSPLQVHRLRSLAAQALLALLEGRVHDKTVQTRMARTLDREFLRDYLVQLYADLTERSSIISVLQREAMANVAALRSGNILAFLRSNTDEYRDVIREESFSLYILIMRLSEEFPEFRETLKLESMSTDAEKASEEQSGGAGSRWKRKASRKGADADAEGDGEESGAVTQQSDREVAKLGRTLHYFERRTGRIEILRDNALLVEYFPIPPMTQFLTLKTKDDFLWKVNRETPTTRLQDFLRKTTDLREEMVHQDRLTKYRVLSQLARSNERFKSAAYVVAVLINLIIISTFEASQHTRDSSPTTLNTEGFEIDSDLDWLESPLTILGYVQTGIQGIVWIFYVINFTKLHVIREWKNIRSRFKERAGPTAFASGQGRIGVRQLLAEGPPLKSDGSQTKKRLSFLAYIVYYLVSAFYVFTDSIFVYYTISLVMSILGNFVNYAFFTFHLLDIMVRNETLKNVVRAVTFNWKQLVMTLVLMVIIIYIFAVVAFFRFRPLYELQVDFGGSTSTQYVCDSLIQCVMVTLDSGLRSGGGIGDFMAEPGWQATNQDFQPEYIAFKISFFILIIVVMLNIIFGIIIDTFADLRNLKNQKEYDMLNFCFICGLERQEFDRHGDGFETHIRHDHNMWQYLYYIVYVTTKDVTELTGTEQYVLNAVNRQSIVPFPLHRARILAHREDTDEEVAEKLDSLQKLLEEVREGQAHNAAEIARVREEIATRSSGGRQRARTAPSVQVPERPPSGGSTGSSGRGRSRGSQNSSGQ